MLQYKVLLKKAAKAELNKKYLMPFINLFKKYPVYVCNFFIFYFAVIILSSFHVHFSN